MAFADAADALAKRPYHRAHLSYEQVSCQRPEFSPITQTLYFQLHCTPL